MKKIAIVQSNYIPWKGYFDLIASVDEFILFDDMQYTRRDWRNRNKIKTPDGVKWLTVPVQGKGKYYQKICDTEIDGTKWVSVHLRALKQNYSKSPYFKEIESVIEPIYLEESWSHLSTLNRRLIEIICDYLEIRTVISNSWNYNLVEGKTERLVDLCNQAGATEYISGPSANGYIDEETFSDNDIKLTWFNYSGYKEYPQLWGQFKHEVTILDLLFNCGKLASDSMRHLNT